MNAHDLCLMDPNEILRELRQLAEHVVKAANKREDVPPVHYGGDLTEEAENMAELFQSLDEWISAGGFFPAVWLVHQHGRGREKRE